MVDSRRVKSEEAGVGGMPDKRGGAWGGRWRAKRGGGRLQAGVRQGPSRSEEQARAQSDRRVPVRRGAKEAVDAQRRWRETFGMRRWEVADDWMAALCDCDKGRTGTARDAPRSGACRRVASGHCAKALTRPILRMSRRRSLANR